MKKTYKSYDNGYGHSPIILIILVTGIICFIACYLIFGDKINQLQLENSKLQRQVEELSVEGELTEHIGDWTCIGKGKLREIRGYATCKTSDGWMYNGDVWGSTFNGQGKLVTPDGEIQEGYFYNGKFRAGKVTKPNGDSVKGLWTKKDENTSTLELGKVFHKDNGNIELGDFNNGYLSYGMRYTILNQIEAYWVGKFIEGSLNDGYMTFPYGCGKLINGNAEEITRTVTNTVYRNDGVQLSKSNPLGDFYKLGSKYNPYTVQLELK